MEFSFSIGTDLCTVKDERRDGGFALKEKCFNTARHPRWVIEVAEISHPKIVALLPEIMLLLCLRFPSLIF